MYKKVTNFIYLILSLLSANAACNPLEDFQQKASSLIQNQQINAQPFKELNKSLLKLFEENVTPKLNERLQEQAILVEKIKEFSYQCIPNLKGFLFSFKGRNYFGTLDSARNLVAHLHPSSGPFRERNIRTPIDDFETILGFQVIIDGKLQTKTVDQTNISLCLRLWNELYEQQRKMESTQMNDAEMDVAIELGKKLIEIGASVGEIKEENFYPFIYQLLADVPSDNHKNPEYLKQQIAESECKEIEFDNRKHVTEAPPLQKDGDCFIHAASDLLAEQYFFASGGELITPSRSFLLTLLPEDEWSFTSNTQGSYVSKILSKITDPKGNYTIFDEKYCPYIYNDRHFIEELKNLFQERNNILNQCQAVIIDETPNSAWPYDYITHIISPSLAPRVETNQEVVQRFMPQPNLFEQSVMVQPNRINFDSILSILRKHLSDKTDDGFIREVLTVYCDESRRRSIKRSDVETKEQTAYFLQGTLQRFGKSFAPQFFNKDPYLKVLKKITNQPPIFTGKRNAHMGALGFCFGPFVKYQKNPTLEFKNEECEGHAVTLASVRWNSQKLRCEGYIRNWHGNNSPLPSDWVNLDDILPFTYKIDYFQASLPAPVRP